MPLRFQRRVKISPGFSLNLNKRSISASVGDAAATLRSDRRDGAPRSVYLEQVYPTRCINARGPAWCSSRFGDRASVKRLVNAIS